MLVLCYHKEHLAPLYLINTDGIKRQGPHIIQVDNIILVGQRTFQPN